MLYLQLLTPITYKLKIEDLYTFGQGLTKRNFASPVAQRASGDRSPDAFWATGDASAVAEQFFLHLHLRYTNRR